MFKTYMKQRVKHEYINSTYNQVADDHCQQEERNAYMGRTVDAVPHGFDPLAAQDAENDHERVQEVGEVPARFLGEVVRRFVIGTEQLLAHDGKDEDYYCQHEAQVAECAHRSPDDADQQVQRRP